MTILSANNPKVKELSALKDKKFRKESGLFLVEGEKMVRECITSGLNVRSLVLREDYEGETYSLESLVLGKAAFAKISDEKSPQGILAVVKIPVYPLRPPQGSCLVLDRISDPANMGAILRTANAAGYTEVYCIDCTDPYSPKSVRASMSGVFFTRIMQGSAEEVLFHLSGVKKIAADMNGENVFGFCSPAQFALCIGNEGSGLSSGVRSLADYTVKIPMGKHTESLNAAVSAGILMYQLKRTNFE